MARKDTWLIVVACALAAAMLAAGAMVAWGVRTGRSEPSVVFVGVHPGVIAIQDGVDGSTFGRLLDRHPHWITDELPDGQRLLHIAIVEGPDDVVAVLLQKGASPDSRGLLGIPAIITAVMEERPQMVRALIAAGADLRAESMVGSAMEVARKVGREDIIQMIEAELSGHDPHSQAE